MKIYFPNYGKSQALDDKHLRTTLGKSQKADKTDIRDNVNSWLEKSIQQVQFKRKHQEKNDENRVMESHRIIQL